MKTYSPEASTPAVAITLATGLCNTQPILFTTQFGNEGTYDGCSESDKPKQSTKLNWVIRELEVSLVRDWGTSAAFIYLTYDLDNQDSLPPPLPDVSSFRKGNSPELGEEDEIRIYAGWVDSTLTPITADLLDETPFDFEDIETKVVSKHNPNKPLVPIFWGFIDKLEFTGSASGGETLVLSCRDRTRVFADTRIISLEAFQGKTNNNLSGEDLSNIANGDRINLLLELSNAAAGRPFGGQRQADSCWKPVTPGLLVRGYTMIKITR